MRASQPRKTFGAGTRLDNIVMKLTERLGVLMPSIISEMGFHQHGKIQKMPKEEG